jgi:hypothetical protein
LSDSSRSGENDLDDHPVVGQNSDQLGTKNSMTLGKCLAILVGFELALGVAVLLLSVLIDANVSLAMIAWAVCAVGTLSAHVFSWYPKGNEFLMARLACATACRTLFPLGFAIWGLKYSEPRIEASVGLILIFAYLAGLAADSYLNLRRSKVGAQPGTTSGVG